MSFWVKNIIFGVVLVGLALYLLLNQDLLFSEDVVVQENGDSAQQEQKKKPIVHNKNAAADGLSKFYASINSSEDKDAPKIRNNIVYLADPKGDLVKTLEARRMVVRALRKSWRGNKESRAFRLGQTLYQKLSEYAKNEGLEVIWWLNRDFLVKDPFRINTNIVKTAYKIGEAIEGHFINGVTSYFCHQQRVLVLIEEPLDYLNEECILLTSKTR